MPDPADGHEATEGQVLAVLSDAVSQLHTLLWLAAMLVWGKDTITMATPNHSHNIRIWHTAPCNVNLSDDAFHSLGSPLVFTWTSTLRGPPLSPSPQWWSSMLAVCHLSTVSTIHRPGHSERKESRAALPTVEGLRSKVV